MLMNLFVKTAQICSAHCVMSYASDERVVVYSMSKDFKREHEELNSTLFQKMNNKGTTDKYPKRSVIPLQYLWL